MDRAGLVAAAGVAALALTLAGCTGEEPRPKLTPTDSSSAAGTASPTPTGPVEPTLPPEARQPTKEGAEAFVRHYWDMVNYAQATGDVTGLRGLAARSCRPCSAGLEFVESTYASGGAISGGAATLSALRTVPVRLAAGSGFQVRMQIATTRQVVDLPGTARDEVFPADNVDAQVIVKRADQGWLVAFWDVA